MIRELTSRVAERVLAVIVPEWEIVPLLVSALMVGIAFSTFDTTFGRWCLEYLWLWAAMFIFAIAIHGSRH